MDMEFANERERVKKEVSASAVERHAGLTCRSCRGLRPRSAYSESKGGIIPSSKVMEGEGVKRQHAARSQEVGHDTERCMLRREKPCSCSLHSGTFGPCSHAGESRVLKRDLLIGPKVLMLLQGD